MARPFPPVGPKFPNPEGHGFQLSLSRKDVKRLGLAGSFIAKAIANNLPQHSIIPGTKAITSEFENSVPTDPIDLYQYGDEIPMLLCNRIDNWSEQRNNLLSTVLNDFTSILFLIGIVLVQAAYAGAHLGALSIMFPSQKERLLWKISCYILFTTTAVYAIALFLQYYLSLIYLGDYFSKFVDEFTTWIVNMFFPVFLCARAYIVIESFISLRHVPVGVYQTPQGNIMDYVPHL